MASLVQGLVKEAKDRQKFEKKRPNAQRQQKAYPASHSFLVSSNWKSIENSVSRKSNAGASPDNIVALDCEMVGIGPKGEESVLARVSIVDFNGKTLCDEYVRPNHHVTDYRQKITGIKPFMLREAKWTHDEALVHVRPLLSGKVVVGHAVDHDFKALEMDHPLHLIRDTSVYRGLRLPQMPNKKPALKKLANHHLNRNIQDGIHCSVEDARIALELYKLRRPQWERRMQAAAASSVPEEALVGGSAASEVGERVERADEGGASGKPKKLSKKERRAQKRAAEAEKSGDDVLAAIEAAQMAGDDVAEVSEARQPPAKKQRKERAEQQNNQQEEQQVNWDSVPGLEEECYESGEEMQFEELLKKSKDDEEEGDLLGLFKELESSRDFCFKGGAGGGKKKKKRKKNKTSKAD